MSQTQTSAEHFGFNTKREKQQGSRQAMNFCLLALLSYAGGKLAFELLF